MKTKKFRAADRASALQLIRDELGPEAMIVREQRVRPGPFGLFGEWQVEILAAIEDDDVPAAAPAARASDGVEASISAAGRQALGAPPASPTAPSALSATAEPRLSVRGRPSQPGGLSDEGAAKLAGIIESFPMSGQPVPPAMAASLADLITRATNGEEVVPPSAAAAANGAASSAPHSPAAPAARPDGAANGTAVSRSSAVTPPVMPPAPAPAASAAPDGPAAPAAPAGDGLGAVQQSILDLQTAVQRLAQQQQDQQLPREAPAVRIVYQQLIQQELDPSLSLELAGSLSEEIGNDIYIAQDRVERRLVEVIESRLLTGQLRLPPHFEFITRTAPPAVAVLIGPTGVGKTTTLAKLASHYAFTEGKKVALVTTDTFRIAAAAQLGTYAEILELPLEVVYRAEEIPAAIGRHLDADVVLVDTPGCGQQDQVRLEELAAFVDAAIAAVPDAAVLLTMAATTKLRDLLHIQRSFGQLPMHGLIFTKLDETTAYGPLVSLAARVRKPVYYVTTGQKVPNDIEIASRRRLARLVLHGLNQSEDGWDE